MLSYVESLYYRPADRKPQYDKAEYDMQRPRHRMIDCDVDCHNQRNREDCDKQTYFQKQLPFRLIIYLGIFIDRILRIIADERSAKGAITQILVYFNAASSTMVHTYLLLLLTVTSMPCFVSIAKKSRSNVGSFDVREKVTKLTPL